MRLRKASRTERSSSTTNTIGPVSSAVLTVADTGIGIPAQDQAALFTRFFRASNAVAGAVPGSGLGMSIARTIVANHEGDISVASAEGAGTTVTVRIALARPGVPPAQTGRAGGSLPA